MNLMYVRMPAVNTVRYFKTSHRTQAREFALFPPQLSFADEADLFRSLEGLRFGATRPSS